LADCVWTVRTPAIKSLLGAYFIMGSNRQRICPIRGI
jgi:hypothetical protein